ncbi:VanW family protein [Modestobacter italicus]|uniref:VanW family protein n=1 Tax=Modestobacter italicus (strain DSM 44449 / CECT 9708 / BC 501) TaxID=2732864 RepID=UPI001C96513B|nr:VanW family protein [Modestobacter italicus]
MPQEPRDDTVRLEPDGTVGAARTGRPPAVPPAARPSTEQPTGAALPAAPEAAQGDEGQVAGPTATTSSPAEPSDTQVIPPVSDGATAVGGPVPAAPVVAARDTDETATISGPPPAAPRDADETATISGPPPAAPRDADETATISGPPPAAGRDADQTALIADRVPADEPTSRPGDDTGTPPPPSGPPGDERPWWRRRAVAVPAAAVLTLGVLYGVDLLIAGDDVPRGTVVAGVDVGGLSPAAASERLESDLAPRIAADHPLVAADVQGVLHPASAGISLDVPATVDVADDQPLNPWTRLTTLVGDREVEPVLAADDTALAAQVEQFATTVDRAPVDASITLDGTTPQLVEPAEGRELDRDAAAETITAALAAGGDPETPIELPVEVTEPRVETAEAERVLEETVTPALAAPVTVVGADGADSVELPVTAIAASLTFTPQDDGSLAVAVDPAALQASTGEEFAAFGSPAQDASFEVSGETITVVPSVDGQGIDPADLAAELLPVLDDPAPRSVTAALGPVPAEFTTEQAEALGIREQVSSFSTNFTNAASGTNIRVVAAEVDGALVRPGETFSLNGYTGPRGTAQGYVPAAVISGGELSQAVGGGISQFATTMFNAVFFAGLEDVYHKPHSFYISRYPAGREATVYEGQIDLQWRNDTETGIYVQTEWVPGTLTVTFWGTRYYDIESISSERRNIRQPAVQEKVDDGNCTPQSGSLGFDITVTRVFQDLTSGAEIRRESFDTRYAAEAIIRCVPPAAPTDPAAVPPATGAPAPSTPAGRRPGARAGNAVRGRTGRRRS